MNYETINWIKEILEITDTKNIARAHSAEHNLVYSFNTEKGSYILKHGPNLGVEKDKLLWLAGKLPVPKVLGFHQNSDGKDDLLISKIDGTDLATAVNDLGVDTACAIYIDALDLIHGVDITDCPFGKKESGFVFTHGDACLPNFIVKDGKLTGIIDVDQAAIGDKTRDIAAAVWSLAYNCGQGAGRKFLQVYVSPNATEEDEIRYIKMYEPTWSGY